MKKYTWQDVYNFERDEYGVVFCPSGDYSEIQSFGNKYRFASDCIFSSNCSFGSMCDFGSWCHFGTKCSFECFCSFATGCSFDDKCSFGDNCTFGCYGYFAHDCIFREDCDFGNNCIFSSKCRFEENCFFGDECEFHGGCICEFGKFTKFAKVDNFGSEGRATYFFNIVDKGIYVRCGCFAGSLKEFRKKVKERHRETKLAKEYLMIADLMEYHFNEIETK